jgi:hypothetical protein
VDHAGGQPPLPLLEAVHGIVARPPEQREPFGTSGYAACLPIMRRLAALKSLDAKRHDLASSAVSLLLEHRDASRH